MVAFYMLFSPKKDEKNHALFKKWLDFMLLLTSYLVTIVTECLKDFTKMCSKEERTAMTTDCVACRYMSAQNYDISFAMLSAIYIQPRVV